MIRKLGLLIGVVAVATLLAQGVGLGMLWYRGQLSSEAIQDISAILKGENDEDLALELEEELKQPSTKDVTKERSMRILELTARENELDRLKNMLSEAADRQLTGEGGFKTTKKAFEDDLKKLDEQFTNEATEQARGILKAMPTEEAVKSLMALELKENIFILKGMAEKSIAKILEQFSLSNDENQVERGEKIFAAISQGDPKKKLVDNALNKITQNQLPSNQ